MRSGAWTPLPHTVRPEHILENGADDDHLEPAVDVVHVRHRRTAEFIDLLHTMSANETTTFEGEFYRADEVALPSEPVQPAPPGSDAKSGSEAGRDVVARCADVLLLTFAPMPDGLETFGTAVVPRLHDLVGAP